VLERAQQNINGGSVDRAVAVQLHLRSAVLAARAGDRDRGDQHVREARAIADQFDPPSNPYYNIDAFRLNIDIHWCAVPVENYNGTTSVERGQHVHSTTQQAPSGSDTTTSTRPAPGYSMATTNGRLTFTGITNVSRSITSRSDLPRSPKSPPLI
jgi:hypothetical protein